MGKCVSCLRRNRRSRIVPDERELIYEIAGSLELPASRENSPLSMRAEEEPLTESSPAARQPNNGATLRRIEVKGMEELPRENSGYPQTGLQSGRISTQKSAPADDGGCFSESEEEDAGTGGSVSLESEEEDAGTDGSVSSELSEEEEEDSGTDASEAGRVPTESRLSKRHLDGPLIIEDLEDVDEKNGEVTSRVEFSLLKEGPGQLPVVGIAGQLLQPDCRNEEVARSRPSSGNCPRKQLNANAKKSPSTVPAEKAEKAAMAQLSSYVSLSGLFPDEGKGRSSLAQHVFGEGRLSRAQWRNPRRSPIATQKINAPSARTSPSADKASQDLQEGRASRARYRKKRRPPSAVPNSRGPTARAKSDFSRSEEPDTTRSGDAQARNSPCAIPSGAVPKRKGLTVRASIDFSWSGNFSNREPDEAHQGIARARNSSNRPPGAISKEKGPTVRKTTTVTKILSDISLRGNFSDEESDEEPWSRTQARIWPRRPSGAVPKRGVFIKKSVSTVPSEKVVAAGTSPGNALSGSVFDDNDEEDSSSEKEQKPVHLIHANVTGGERRADVISTASSRAESSPIEEESGQQPIPVVGVPCQRFRPLGAAAEVALLEVLSDSEGGEDRRPNSTMVARPAVLALRSKETSPREPAELVGGTRQAKLSGGRRFGRGLGRSGRRRDDDALLREMLVTFPIENATAGKEGEHEHVPLSKLELLHCSRGDVTTKDATVVPRVKKSKKTRPPEISLAGIFSDDETTEQQQKPVGRRNCRREEQGVIYKKNAKKAIERKSSEISLSGIFSDDEEEQKHVRGRGRPGGQHGVRVKDEVRVAPRVETLKEFSASVNGREKKILTNPAVKAATGGGPVALYDEKDIQLMAEILQACVAKN